MIGPFLSLFAALMLYFSAPAARAETGKTTETVHCDQALTAEIRSGDLIFTEVDNFLYRRVARVSGGWTSHVGIILRDENNDWVVYESRPPRSVKTPLCDFIARNSQGRIAISRLEGSNIGPSEEKRLREAAAKRMGIRYDLWFNYDSQKSTFCSKFVDAVYEEALGIEVGKIESLEELFKNISGTTTGSKDLKFWKTWFLGRIPWQQRTLSPQSQFSDKHFHVWYDTQLKPLPQ